MYYNDDHIMLRREGNGHFNSKGLHHVVKTLFNTSTKYNIIKQIIIMVMNQ